MKSLIAVTMIVVLLATGLGLAISGIVPGFKLCVVGQVCNTLPTNPGYPATGAGNTIVNYNVQGDAPAGTTNTVPIVLSGCNDVTQLMLCPLYSVSGGSLYIPAGLVGDSHHIVYCAPLTGCGNPCPPAGDTCANAYWAVQNPPSISLDCVPNSGISGVCTDARGNDLVASTTGNPGGTLLTSANPVGDPTCSPGGSSPLPTCWQQDYNIIKQAQIFPNCNYNVVSQCLTWTASSNMTVSNAISYLQTHPPMNGLIVGNCTVNSTASSFCTQQIIGSNYNCASCSSNVVQISQANWYLYRLITDILLAYSPPAVQVQCLGGGSCTACSTFVYIPTLWCPDNGQLSSIVQNQFIPELNKASDITGAQIVFGVSVNGLVPQCPSPVDPSTCFFGIAGMWLGAQGLQPSGCASNALCSISNLSNTPHYQFGLYSCPQITPSCIASVPSAQDLINLAAVTNSSINSVQQKSLYGTIYSAVNIASFGAQYNSGGCTVGNLPSCINNPTPVYINIPLIYDVIGSYTNYFYRYPGIPPNGGTNSGIITGHVYGVGSGLLGLGNAPIVGACVGIGGPCTGYSGQIQKTTAGDGSYSISLPGSPAYEISASAMGYIGATQFQIPVSVGANTVVDFTLNPVNPPGQTCLLQPSYSPIPPYQQLFPGICIPTWSFYLLVALGIGIPVVAVIVYFAGPEILISRVLGKVAE